MGNQVKNWRGLPAHPADEWDHWTDSLARYEELVALYDLLVSQVDRNLLLQFVARVGEFERSEAAEAAAGESI